MLIDANFPDINTIWEMYLDQEIRNSSIDKGGKKSVIVHNRILTSLGLKPNCNDSELIKQQLTKLIRMMDVTETAAFLGCSTTTLKRICRDVNIPRWNHRWYKAQHKRTLKRQFASTYRTSKVC
jgi:DNA invertase Pin-like site-specific DNA recombinase